jgi:hypothetical protein
MENCKKVSDLYAGFTELADKFKTLDFKKEKKSAFELKIKLEAAITVLNELNIEGVHIRKRLADSLGYLYIGKFDESGLAIAFKREFGLDTVFINRKGETPLGPDFHPYAPFKNGYSFGRNSYYSYGQLKTENILINRKGESVPWIAASVSVSWHPAHFDRYAGVDRTREAISVQFEVDGVKQQMTWNSLEVFGNLLSESFGDHDEVVEEDADGNAVFKFSVNR